MAARGDRPGHPGWNIVGVFILMAAPLAYWYAGRHTLAQAHGAELARATPQAARDGFVTSDRCEACHPSQYHSWHRGYHRTMTQYASPVAVRGNFDNVHLTGGGYDLTLYRNGDDFMADMVDPLWQYEVDFGQRDVQPGELGPRVRKRIALVTGSHHMQAYWVESGEGNGLLSLPFTYLFEDKRWVPRGEVFLHEPGERHQIQVWNVSCITCHATAGQPNALVGGKAVQTKVGEMGIGCESCHGPAEAHVAANRNPLRRYLSHLGDNTDDTIVNPRRLDQKRANMVCAQCHALTDLDQDVYLGDGKKYRAGDDLDRTQPLLQPSHPNSQLEAQIKKDPAYLKSYFWADGTIRVSSRDYSGMVESKCMTSGTMWCGSCHSVHDADPDRLVAAGKDGDGACIGCHAKITPAHTHHAADSPGSRCMNCHMPFTVYGLLKGIRQHRIDSPRVTGASGGSERPNACNLCHVDKNLAWTAGALGKWYGQPVAANLPADAPPAAVDWMLSGDAVLRAIASWQFGWSGARKAADVDAFVPYLVAALADPYAAVRYVAGHALAAIDPANQFDYLGEPGDRRRQADAILARWRAKSSTPRPDPQPLIDQLVQRRDNTPTRALE